MDVDDIDFFGSLIVCSILVGVISCLLMHGCDKEDAVRAGHAEYYINTNNFEKEWRWKECK